MKIRSIEVKRYDYKHLFGQSQNDFCVPLGQVVVAHPTEICIRSDSEVSFSIPGYMITTTFEDGTTERMQYFPEMIHCWDGDQRKF